MANLDFTPRLAIAGIEESIERSLRKELEAEGALLDQEAESLVLVLSGPGASVPELWQAPLNAALEGEDSLGELIVVFAPSIAAGAQGVDGAYEWACTRADEADLALRFIHAAPLYGPGSGGLFGAFAALTRSGAPLPFAESENRRSLLSVRNLAKGILATLVEDEERFVFADGAPLSTGEIAAFIADGLGTSAKFVSLPEALTKGLISLVSDRYIGELFGDFELEGARFVGEGSEPELREFAPHFATGSFRMGSPAIRALDIALASAGLAAAWPVMLVVLGLGYFDTGSPLFFQERVGKDQKPFTLVKFRTMDVDTKSVATNLVSAAKVTRLGAILRKTKLDELPQLINVLRGDMSLVGPRPGLFNQLELRQERSKRGVYDVRPGITGLGQVNEVDMSTPEKLSRLDAKMVREFELLDYVSLIAQTLGGRGMGDRVKRP